MPVERFTDPPPGAVWLADALRQFVSPDLWIAFEKIGEGQRHLPRTATLYPNDFEDAHRLNHIGNKVLRLRREREVAFARIRSAFVQAIIAGELDAYGYRPLEGWYRLPGQIWPGVRIRNIKLGIVAARDFEVSRVFVLPRASQEAAAGVPALSAQAILLREATRRIEAGEAYADKRQEARFLKLLMDKLRPDKRLSIKTITNRLNELKKPAGPEASSGRRKA